MTQLRLWRGWEQRWHGDWCARRGFGESGWGCGAGYTRPPNCPRLSGPWSRPGQAAWITGAGDTVASELIPGFAGRWKTRLPYRGAVLTPGDPGDPPSWVLMLDPRAPLACVHSHEGVDWGTSPRPPTPEP